MLREITSTVKWYDPSRRYGFLHAVDDAGDSLIHLDQLEQANITRLAPGDRVTCLVRRMPNGLRVETIKNVAHIRAPTVDRCAELEPVVVRWFDGIRGFGFVASKSSNDIMLHAKSCRTSGLVKIERGMRMLVRITKGPDGLRVESAYAMDERVS